MDAENELLGAAAAADAIRGAGWRLLIGGAYTSVAVDSLVAAAEVATAAVGACGPDADHLRLDLAADRVELALRTPDTDRLSRHDATLADRITTAVAGLGLTTTPGGPGVGRPVQALEIAVDALDIAALVPFWRAAFGYAVATRPIAEGQEEVVVVDPAGQGPTIWFQQMDAPRPQRNRVHFDVTVAEDEAEARIAAVLAAGGRIVNDTQARAFVVVADPEGNEVCICTWQDRD